MSLPIEILVFGDLLWIHEASRLVLGGCAASFSFRLDSLGTRVAFVSRVGKDELGARAMQELDDLGMSTRWLQIDPLIPTISLSSARGLATSLATAQEAPDASVPYAPFDHIVAEEPILELADQAKAIYFNALSCREPVSKLSLREVVSRSITPRKIFDIRLRPGAYSPESIPPGLEIADVAFIRTEDLSTLCDLTGVPNMESDLVCNVIVERFDLTACIAIDPVGGVVGASRSDENFVIPPSSLRSTISAVWEDAFRAGCVHKLLESVDLKICCDFGRTYADSITTEVDHQLAPCAHSHWTRRLSR
jgi:fructokinase